MEDELLQSPPVEEFTTYMQFPAMLKAFIKEQPNHNATPHSPERNR